MKRCPVCGKTFDDGRRFCDVDGSRLESVSEGVKEVRTHEIEGSEAEKCRDSDNYRSNNSDKATDKSSQTDGTPEEASGMICPVCRTRYPSSEKFCVKDGTRLIPETPQPEQNEKICPLCHTRYPADQVFCVNDGSRLIPYDPHTDGALNDRKIVPPAGSEGKRVQQFNGQSEYGRTEAHRSASERQRDTQTQERHLQQLNRPSASEKKSHTGFIVLAVVLAAVIVLLTAGILAHTGIIRLPFHLPFIEQDAESDSSTDSGKIAADHEQDTADPTGSGEEPEESTEAVQDDQTGNAVDTGNTEEAAAEDTAAEEEALIEEMANAIRSSYELGSSDRVEYAGTNQDGDYVFDVGSSDGSAQYGEVAVDPDTQDITVVEGMVTSPIADFDADAVASDVDKASGNGRSSFAVIDLDTLDLAGSSNMEDGQSASVMVDIPILYTAMIELQEGTIGMDEPVTFHYEVDGRTKLTRSANGQSFPLSELMSYMLLYSDNNATNSLLDYFGMGIIANTCHENGYDSVRIAGKIAKTDDYTDNDNYVSAADLAGMLGEIWNSDTDLGRSYLEDNMIIQDSARNAGIGKEIGGSVDGFLNLNGQKADKYNEVAVIEENGNAYGVVFLGNHGKLETLQKAAGVLGKDVYNETNDAE